MTVTYTFNGIKDYIQKERLGDKYQLILPEYIFEDRGFIDLLQQSEISVEQEQYVAQYSFDGLAEMRSIIILSFNIRDGYSIKHAATLFHNLCRYYFGDNILSPTPVRNDVNSRTEAINKAVRKLLNNTTYYKDPHEKTLLERDLEELGISIYKGSKPKTVLELMDEIYEAYEKLEKAESVGKPNTNPEDTSASESELDEFLMSFTKNHKDTNQGEL